MTRSFFHLRVAALTLEGHEQTCGYWFTVTNGSTAHTAFATRAGLDRWMHERNLALPRGAGLPRGSSVPIRGGYYEHSHMDWREFEAVRPVVITAKLSNADYTLALISEDDDGVRTVHFLNPNVKTRLVFDHKHMRELMS